MNVADDDGMGAYWRDVKSAGQAKRASNRESSAAVLQEAGVLFESKNAGAHLIVQAGERGVVDFWPGTGLWIARSTPGKHYGVRNLLAFCGLAPKSKTA